MIHYLEDGEIGQTVRGDPALAGEQGGYRSGQECDPATGIIGKETVAVGQVPSN